MRIRWTAPAADDLEEIKRFLDTRSPDFSRQTIRKLYDAARSLRTMPERGRPGLRRGSRELILHPLPYIIVYWIKHDAVEILRIYHGAQNRLQ